VWCPGEATVCSKCAGATTSAPAAGGAPPPGAMKTMIPTGNKPALIGYYFVYVAILPAVQWTIVADSIPIDRRALDWFGIVFGVAAAVFGGLGLRVERERPEARGGKHAWFAVVVGALCAAAWCIVAFGK